MPKENNIRYEGIKSIISFYQETLERILGAEDDMLSFFTKIDLGVKL